jgi:hypothetical protein
MNVIKPEGGEMKNKLFLTLVLVGLFVCSLAGFSSQDFLTQAGFKLKAMKPQGFEKYQGMLTWVPVSKKNNVGFAKDYIAGSDEYRLVSQVFSTTGKCLLSTPFAEGKGHARWAEAVWLPGDAQSLSQHQAPAGLVFVLFNTSRPWDSAAYGGECILSVARFDENGVRIGDWVDLTTIKADPKYRIIGTTMGVSVGEDCVGVAVCAEMLAWEPHIKFTAFFMRTDFEGNPIHEKPVALKVPSKGNMPLTLVFRPAWNGVRWLVPMIYGSAPWGSKGTSQVYIFASKDEKAKKFQAKLIDRDKQDQFAYEYLFLVPAPTESSPPAAKVQTQGLPYLLFVQHVMVHYAGKNTELFYDYNLYPINKKGKKAAPGIEVMIPSEAQSHHIYNRFSNILPSYSPGEAGVSAQSNDDFLFIALTKALWSYPPKQWFYYYAINPQDGSVATLAQCVKQYDPGIFGYPQLRENGKLIELINQAGPSGNARTCVTYFSKFKK